MAQLMPLPLTVSCFSKIEIGFTFLVPAHPGSRGQRAVKRVCVCVNFSTLSVIILSRAYDELKDNLTINRKIFCCKSDPSITQNTATEIEVVRIVMLQL